MQIDAIYDNGRLIFTKPVRLKKKRLQLKVMIPDTEIETGQVEDMSKPGIRTELNDILGSIRRTGQKASPEQDKTAWHEHLEDKYIR